MIAHVAWRLSRRAALNLWRAPLPSLVAVLTIALSLFIATTFVLGVSAARALFTSWGAQASMTLYLDETMTDAQARAVIAKVQAEAPRAQIVYVDRELALKRLRVELGDLSGALDALARNPLPASIEVTPPPALAPASLRVLAAQFAQVPGVHEVEYGREWLDKVEALGRGVRNFGAGALFVVLGAALLVIANTIRLAVYARRDEIEIMKLVGATDQYVRAPFLLEGALQGLLGAGLALGSVASLDHWLLPRAQQALSFASGVAAPRIDLLQSASLLVAGTLVGLLGSWLAVSRFLRT
jgi:cell division transport system permease protein